MKIFLLITTTYRELLILLKERITIVKNWIQKIKCSAPKNMIIHAKGKKL